MLLNLLRFEGGDPEYLIRRPPPPPTHVPTVHSLYRPLSRPLLCRDLPPPPPLPLRPSAPPPLPPPSARTPCRALRARGGLSRGAGTLLFVRRRSFFQFQQDKQRPVFEDKIRALETERRELIVPDEPVVHPAPAPPLPARRFAVVEVHRPRGG